MFYINISKNIFLNLPVSRKMFLSESGPQVDIQNQMIQFHIRHVVCSCSNVKCRFLCNFVVKICAILPFSSKILPWSLLFNPSLPSPFHCFYLSLICCSFKLLILSVFQCFILLICIHFTFHSILSSWYTFSPLHQFTTIFHFSILMLLCTNSYILPCLYLILFVIFILSQIL